MSRRLVIVNDFTNRRTTIDTSKPLTAAKIRAIRRRLCADTSGDTLGARGPQQEQYRAFLQRAEQIMLTES